MNEENSATLSPERLPGESAAARPQPVVLLADDEEPFRELLTSVLHSIGCHVHVAADRRAALRLLARERVDLVITDLCMPGTDGMEFLTALRTARNRVPVIVMSGGVGSNMAGMLRAAELLGARRTLAKTFPLPDFVRAVRENLPAD